MQVGGDCCQKVVPLNGGMVRIRVRARVGARVRARARARVRVGHRIKVRGWI